MPDDNTELEQVAEQDVQEVEAPDQEVDEANAFDVEDDDEKQDDGNDTPTGDLKADEDDEGQPEQEAEAEDTEDTDDDQDGEDDEDISRGKSLLEAEQAAEEERKRKEAEAARAAQNTGGQTDTLDPTKDSYDSDYFETLNSVLPKNLFPKEPVKLSDGTTLDFKAITDEFPELPHYVAGIAHNMVRQLIASGRLVDKDTFEAEKNGITQKVSASMYNEILTNPHTGVSNAYEIARSDKFKEWFPKQSKEIQALQKGGAHDHVRLLKRFINEDIFGKAKAEAKDKDEKRRQQKEKFDSVHRSSPAKKRKTQVNKSNMDPKEEERLAFESDDDDNIL